MSLLNFGLHIKCIRGCSLYLITKSTLALVLNGVHSLFLHRYELVLNQLVFPQLPISFLIRSLKFGRSRSLSLGATLIDFVPLGVFAWRPLIVLSVAGLINELVGAEVKVRFADFHGAYLANVVSHRVRFVSLEVLLGDRLVGRLVVPIGELLHTVFHHSRLLIGHFVV